MLDWWDQFESFRGRQKKVTVPQSQRLQNNQAWVPMYDGDGDILRREYGVGAPSADMLDPIVAAMTADEFDALMPEWDA